MVQKWSEAAAAWKLLAHSNHAGHFSILRKPSLGWTKMELNLKVSDRKLSNCTDEKNEESMTKLETEAKTMIL